MHKIKLLFYLYAIAELWNIYKQFKLYQQYKQVVPSKKVSDEYTKQIVKQIRNDPFIISKLVRVYGDATKVPYVDIFNMLYHVIYCKLHKFYTPKNKERSTIITTINYIQTVTGLKFNRDENSKQQGVFYGNEPLFFFPTLLPVQSIFKLVHVAKYLSFEYHNFQHKVIDKNISVYTKNNGATDKVTVIVHGLGVGIIPYMTFIKKVNSFRTVVAFELPNISKDKLCFPVPSHQEISQILAQYVKTNYAERPIELVLHSFGTTFLKSLLQTELKFDKIILIDPICFYQTALPSAKYFCSTFYDKVKFFEKYHPHLKADSYSFCKQMLYQGLLHFVLFDLHSQYVCKRLLWGVDKWIDDIPGRSMVMLAEKEYFYNAGELKVYLEAQYPQVEVNFNKGGSHGDLIISDRLQQQVVDFCLRE